MRSKYRSLGSLLDRDRVRDPAICLTSTRLMSSLPLFFLWDLQERVNHSSLLHIRGCQCSECCFCRRYCMGAMVTHVIIGMETKVRRTSSWWQICEYKADYVQKGWVSQCCCAHNHASFFFTGLGLVQFNNTLMNVNILHLQTSHS